MLKKFSLKLALISLLVSHGASADELIMVNGSRLVGTLISAESDTVVFDTPFAGQLTIKQENIESITADEGVTVVMEDGTLYESVPVAMSDEEGQVRLGGRDLAPVAVAVNEIELLNPEPWRLGQGYHWYGNVSVALAAERGNSDTDEWDGALASTWRSLKDRYVLRGSFEVDEANGDKNTDNWAVFSKYDRFRKDDPDDYYGVKLNLEYDRFTDLDLRTIFGPHVGRQFLETSLISLQGEVGPVWVDEQFDVAEDDDWPGAMWLVQASSDIIGFGTTLYVRHDGIFNFDETDELVLNTTVGIKMPLIFGLETSFEAKYEYDGGAVENIDDTDETYNFRIGYAW